MQWFTLYLFIYFKDNNYLFSCSFGEANRIPFEVKYLNPSFSFLASDSQHIEEGQNSCNKSWHVLIILPFTTYIHIERLYLREVLVKST